MFLQVSGCNHYVDSGFEQKEHVLRQVHHHVNKSSGSGYVFHESIFQYPYIGLFNKRNYGKKTKDTFQAKQRK